MPARREARARAPPKQLVLREPRKAPPRPKRGPNTQGHTTSLGPTHLILVGARLLARTSVRHFASEVMAILEEVRIRV